MMVSRREFVGTCVAAMSGCAVAPTIQTRISNQTIRLNRAEVTAMLANGIPAQVVAPELESAVLLIPVGDGSLRALSARCTHLGCAVRLSSRTLECPCHASSFDMTGNVLHGPAPRPLPSYPVTVTESTVEIDVSSGA